MATDLDTIETFVAEVVRTTAIGPFVRVTLAGDGLARADEIGPDDFVYLLLPPPGRSELTVGPGFRWADVPRMAPADKPVGAYYTVVERRPASHEIDIDVLVHDPPGVASSWAVAARPGDPAALWGPRTAWDPPSTVDRIVLLADETGLPAMVRILDHVTRTDPRIATVAILELGPHGDAPVLSVPAGRSISVRRRTTPDALPLVEALTAGVRPGSDLVWGPSGSPTRPYVWAGAERATIDELRTRLRSDWGVPADRLSLTAYWRRDPVDDPST
ncbi:MAG: siderophore-interacting protein [Acidimicrobiales bacterium]